MAAIAEAGLRVVEYATYAVVAIALYALLRTLYNISPLHPLYKYPGPLAWRAARLPASFAHANGTLYQRIDAIHKQYGPIVRIAPDELSFTNPEAWPQIYNSRPQLQKTIYHFAQDEDARLPESMITATDSEHARLRRLTGSAFLSTGIKEVEPVLQRYVDLLCLRLEEASKKGSQNMVEWFLWTLNDVIGKLALDEEFECLAERRMHPWPSFLLNVLKLSAVINQFRRFGLRLKWLAPLMSKKDVDARESFLKLASDAVKTRLAREENDTSAAGDEKRRLDFLGLMMRDMKNSERLTEAELTSNSILIVGGGAETTSTCLSATMYNLCKTPRVLKKLQNEIRTTFSSSADITLQTIGKLDYLKATIDESLRVFPVASYITPRITPSSGHVIAGEVIPGGTYVSMAQWHMGRSKDFFDNPYEFRPERWLAVGGTEPNTMTPDEVLRPFSLGARNCIGKLLALAEARLVTAKLLWHFDIELDGTHDTWVEDARFFVLWELQPLMVKFTSVQ